MRTSSSEDQRAEMVDEFGSQTIMLYEETHVDGAIEGVEEQVGIYVLAQFAATHRAMKRGIGFVATRPKKAIAKGGDEARIALPGGEDRGHDTAFRAAENFDQLPHLPSHVGVDGSGVGKVKFADSAIGKGVGNQGCLVGPPAIHSSFANLGTIGDFLDGEIGKSGFS